MSAKSDDGSGCFIVIVLAVILMGVGSKFASGARDIVAAINIQSGVIDDKIEVIPDEHGNPTFRWREVTTKE